MKFKEFKKLVKDCRCHPYFFVVGKMGDGFFLQPCHERVDSVTGEIGIGKGRKYYQSRHSCRNEIVQACLLASLSMAEHEVRERFTYRDTNIFMPHLDPDELVTFRKTTKVNVRKPMPKEEK